MTKLYQVEWCPFSHRVRAKLTELGVPYEAINVRAEGEERTEIKELTGDITTPVLVDGEKVLSESSEIISYLEENYSPAEPEDARAQREELSPTISGVIPLSFGEALERAREALQEAGFELLGELDLASKLDWEGSFIVLVALEQEFAKQVADTDPAAIGLVLLKIAVYEQDGQVHASAVKPQRAAAPIRNPEIYSSGLEVQGRLAELVESLEQKG